MRESNVETCPAREAPVWEQADYCAAVDDSAVRHHALNARYRWGDQLLRVEWAGSEPETISVQVHPDDLNGAKTGADGGAKRLLVPVENDG